MDQQSGRYYQLYRYLASMKKEYRKVELMILFEGQQWTLRHVEERPMGHSREREVGQRERVH